MAGELKHLDVGTELTKTEWEAINTHVLDGGVAGDILYYDGTQLKRLPVGGNGLALIVAAGIPAWAAGPATTVNWPPRVIVGADSALDADIYIEVDMTAGPYALTLPTVVGRNGKFWIVKKISNDSNTLTITPAGGETIELAANLTIDLQGTSIMIIGSAAALDWRLH